jgi:hypothetical protein
MTRSAPRSPQAPPSRATRTWPVVIHLAGELAEDVERTNLAN